MEQITVIQRDGTKINLISTDPFRAVTSYSLEDGLMSDDYVKINVKSSDMLKFGIGDKIIVGSKTYTIRTSSTAVILSDNSYTYELTFYGALYDLMRQLYRNCDSEGKSDKSTFDLTYKLKDFAKVIINNMERDYPGEWILDEANCPDTVEKTFTFDGQNCLQVLQTLCKSENFNYDFLITQSDGVHTLHLGKFGSVITPPNGESYFEVGKGKGLYKLKADKVDDKSITTRLYVEGGTTNIRSSYRGYSDRLQLPYPVRLNTRAHTLSDGTVVAIGAMSIGILDDSKRYFEDTALKNKIGSIEDVSKTDDIFPCRTGKVTALGSDVYTFIDDTMDFDLNEKWKDTDDDYAEYLERINSDETRAQYTASIVGGTKWLISDTTAKITFTSGFLAGQQFELKKSGGYESASKSFKIIKYTDERGLSFPSETSSSFQIQIGDTYKITDINLPKAYEDDAEEDLWFYGYDKFLQAKQTRVQFTATFTEDFFLHYLPTDSTSDLFNVGDYLPIKDTRFGVEKNIRITKITRNLMKRYDYTLTISDTNTINVVSQIVADVINHETIINQYGLKDLSKSRRGWRTTEDLRNMIFDTDGYFDCTNIKPNSIDTNMLTVGSKSQQFVLVGVILQANVNGLPNVFYASGGILAHFTILADSIRTWNMVGSTVTLTESGGYYVYAKCSKSGTSGSFYVTQAQLKFEPTMDSGNYYFLIGIIGSVVDNVRDFTTTYGFTRINGRVITTGKITSSDGYCYLDLDNNLFQLANGENISNSTSGIAWSNGQLTIKGTIVQNQGGITAELGLYRGTYQGDTIYYKGDEVSYNDGSQTCTYRYTNTTASSGKLPTDSAYWSVIVNGAKGDQGAKGDDPNYYEYRYAKNGSTTTPPALDSTAIAPDGWSTTIPSLSTLEYLWLTVAMKTPANVLVSSWSTPMRITPRDGENGDKGDKGENPVLVFRGVYDASKTYYGTTTRLDAVKYNGAYYIARIDAGSIVGVLPTDSTKWNTFGAELETIATNLLLAEGASIGSWSLTSGNIVSTLDETQNNKILLQVGYWSGSTFIYSPKIILESSLSGGDHAMNTGFGSKIQLDATSGIVEVAAKNHPSYSTGTSYLSVNGIFANLAGTDGMPASTGYTHRGAVVGLGFANVNKSDWALNANQSIVAGIYGRANNSGTAPAYGGYFNRLYAAGLTLSKKAIETSSDSTYLNNTDSLIIGYTSNIAQIIYLPTDPNEGDIIFFKQWGSGSMRIYPRSGQVIYDDNTANDYYDCACGECLMAMYTIGYLNSVEKDAWLVGKFKF